MLIVKIISELIIEMVLEKQLRLRIPVPTLLTFSDRGDDWAHADFRRL